jgi:ribosomal protein S18 acetylase RimI-like enzyme
MDNKAPSLGGLVRLNKAEIKPAAEMLARAFQGYPLLKCVFPSELERRRIASYYFQYELAYAVQCGEVYATSSRLEGVATWMTSDSFPMKIWKSVRSVPLSVTWAFARGGALRLKPVGDYLDARHTQLVPFRHWYLQTIGVAPESQGRGYATNLIQSMLVRIDTERMPCYLETLDKINVPIYEHFGFKVIEESAIPKTNLTNWAMLREVSTSGI